MKKFSLFLLVIATSSFAQIKIENGTQLSLSNGGFLYVKEPIVNEGTLTLNSGKLIIANNFTTSGTLSAANATIEVSGGETQSFTFGSNDVVKRLELNKSGNIATVAAGKLTITDGLKSTAGNLNAAERIILKSTSTKTAIVEESASGTVDNIVVERYIPAKRAFRLLSSPVTTSTTIKYNWQENQNNTSPLYTNNSNTVSGYGTHITGSTSGANGFDASQTGSPSLFIYNNTTQAWTAISDTDTNTLNAGAAYRLMVRGDRSIDTYTNTPTPTVTTLRTTGTLKIGSHSVTGLNTTANAHNFIGNPYQSPINIENVLSASTNINSNYYYVWDPKVGGDNGRGAFVTYSFLTSSNNFSGSAVNQYLQPMQACFVDTFANGAASVVFAESNKFTTTNENVYRNASSAIPTLRLNLFDVPSFQQGSTALDGVLCFFGEEYSNGLDSYDAGKLSNLDENLSIKLENSDHSIVTLNYPILTSEYAISLSNYKHQNYVFKAQLENYNGLTPYLLDQLTTTYFEIQNNSSYNFTISPNNPLSSASDRFKIVFQTPALSINDFGRNIKLYPNPANAGDSFFIEVNMETATITLHNILGQSIPVTVKNQGNLIQVTPKDIVSQGIYIVTISNENQKSTVKWVVK
jgi:hypothetical protein